MGAVIVGIAIIVGIELFSSSSIASNKDALLNDLQNLGQYAYRYKLRPEPMGGGGRVYTGFNIPVNLASNGNGSYRADVTPGAVTLVATSATGYGSISACLDSNGVLNNFSYTGNFQ